MHLQVEEFVMARGTGTGCENPIRTSIFDLPVLDPDMMRAIEDGNAVLCSPGIDDEAVKDYILHIRGCQSQDIAYPARLESHCFPFIGGNSDSVAPGCASGDSLLVTANVLGIRPPPEVESIIRLKHA